MIVPPSDGDTLAAAALRARVRDVRHESIPYANHVFSGREAVAVERCVRWLDDVILGQKGATGAAGMMGGPVADLRSGSPTE